MTTPIPPEITTPDTVDTSIGTLKFFDGVPTNETAEKVYDQIDFSRGVEVFLNGIPGVSIAAIRAGSRAVGGVDGTIGVFQNFLRGCSIDVVRAVRNQTTADSEIPLRINRRQLIASGESDNLMGAVAIWIGSKLGSTVSKTP